MCFSIRILYVMYQGDDDDDDEDLRRRPHFILSARSSGGFVLLARTTRTWRDRDGIERVGPHTRLRTYEMGCCGG